MSAEEHLLVQVTKYGDRTAICTPSTTCDTNGEMIRTSYATLCSRARGLSQIILQRRSGIYNSTQPSPASDGGQQQQQQQQQQQPRIAFMCGRNASYVIAQWSIWISNGIGVPLHASHPIQEIQYILQDCSASMILTDSNHLDSVTQAALLAFTTQTTKIPIVLVEESESSLDDNVVDFPVDHHFAPDSSLAQILYTSGTTGKPKGVVMTHKNITAQIRDLAKAWEVTEHDRILHFLPLHHIHGILNNLLVPLYCGACVIMLPSANPKLIWEYMENATILTAVPTIYHTLVEWYHHDVSQQQQQEVPRAQTAARQLRLCMSGSMSCPIPLIQEWETITGHRILERYGMTELGMVLSQPLHGGTRYPGYVGTPLPSVRVQLLQKQPEQQQEQNDDSSSCGELLVQGDTVFHSYWNRPEETAQAFTQDGWFRTGDMAEYCSKMENNYRILGRMSVDILKSGGYKLSAVEIEAVLLQCPGVAETYVIGVPDDKWGQVVTAVVRTTTTTIPQMDQHARTHLASYKVPRHYVCLDSIPKNAMGKVNKKQLLDLVIVRNKNDSNH